MKKQVIRTLSTLMTVFLLLGVFPGFAMAAEDVTYNQGDTFEFKGNTYEVISGTVTITEESVHGNTQPKIKFNNTENTTASVKTTITPSGISGRMLVAADFTVAALSEGNGLQMSKIRTTGVGAGESGYFTNTTYAFWRKIGLTDNACIASEVTVSFSGIGTAYIKGVRLEGGIFMNLDFSALSGEGYPSDWITDGRNTSPLITDATDTTSKGWRLIETAEGNWIEANDITRAAHIQTSAPSSLLEAGALYRVSVTTAGALGFDTEVDSSHVGLLPRGDSSYATWTTTSSEWKVKTCTMINGSFSSKTNFYIRFRPHNPAGNTVTKIKNVKVEKVTDSFSVVDADGNAVSQLTPGDTVTVSYEKPIADIEALYIEDIEELTLAMIGEGLYSTTKVSLLAGLYKETENGKMLVAVNIVTDNSSTVTVPSGVPTTTEDNIGVICPKATVAFTIPNDGGEYSIQYMAWDSMGGMQPSGTLFTFPAAPAAE